MVKVSPFAATIKTISLFFFAAHFSCKWLDSYSFTILLILPISSDLSLASVFLFSFLKNIQDFFYVFFTYRPYSVSSVYSRVTFQSLVHYRKVSLVYIHRLSELYVLTMDSRLCMITYLIDGSIWLPSYVYYVSGSFCKKRSSEFTWRAHHCFYTVCRRYPRVTWWYIYIYAIIAPLIRTKTKVGY